MRNFILWMGAMLLGLMIYALVLQLMGGSA